MAKFFGVIGYGHQEETEPGVSDVYVDVIREKPYFGDVLAQSRTTQEGDKVNNDVSVGVTLSIMSDPYANQHYAEMRYVKWEGVYWIIAKRTPKYPRLELSLGGVYNGPTAETESPVEGYPPEQAD